MAPSRKTGRGKTTCPPKIQLLVAWKLPRDMLLEIVSRLDLRTFIRCAATCKVLRHDLLSPPFIRRITQQAAPCILANFCTGAKKRLLTLVHPSTPAASSFCNNHLSRFLSRKDAAKSTLLGKYELISSRRGLLVLRRLNIKNRPKSDHCSDICVYDPMSGVETFFSNPPEIKTDNSSTHKYMVLTADDGIGYSLMLLVFDIYYEGAKVHTSSSCGRWETVTYGSDIKFPRDSPGKRENHATLSSGIIYWLLRPWIPTLSSEIRSYDLCTGKTGTVQLPPGNYHGNQLHLVALSDRKLLKLLAIQGFMMFVWIKHPVSAAAGGSGWSLETRINMEEKIRSLQPDITSGPDYRIEFEGSGKSTGDVVFLVIWRRGYSDDSDAFILFDLETKEMHRKKYDFPLLEIDLPSRLQTMKIFS